MKTIEQNRRLWLGILGMIVLASFIACKKKEDPAVADAGGGVATKRVVITMQGGAR